jgi:hypothetical protein
MNKDSHRMRLHGHDSVETLSGTVGVAVTWAVLYLVIIAVGLSPLSSQFIAMVVQR